jgi:NAD(P)-dependent dehydrogenase (short-subunit alcohol dehydrogenase family)
MSISRRLIADGYEVFGSYESADADAANTLQQELENLTLIEVDHADRVALDAFAAAVRDQEISVLVNAQFYFAMEDLDDFDYTLWDRSLAVNLTAPVYMFHALRKHFASPASVVTITSTEAFRGSFGASAYAATKAAVHNATMTMANVGGSAGIRANAVAAGWIGGVMDTDEVFNMSRSITPMGRLGSPDEVAACVAFLASPESAFVNGTVLVADGGYLCVDPIAKYEFESEQP